MNLPLTLGFNSLLIVVDWLIKFFSLLPCTFEPVHPFGVGGMADLLVCYIVYKYSVPQFIVHD